ncbi:MAG: VIT1/CCC1 transporter family protein [Chloroflexi bacterium]|nr:VIT1/CCC1 transporter family protein [Chloroflexota bacterium]
MTAETPEEGQAATPEEIKRLQANLDDEIDGIAIYEMLSEVEPDPERKAIFDELAVVEVKHAELWREKLREAGVEPREHGPSLKMRLLGRAAKVFGVKSVLPIVRSFEAEAYGVYMAQGAAGQSIAPDEREHRKTMARMSKPSTAPVEAIAARETWHRGGGGGTLRATVFGVSDGLVSNSALVMGFAGASTGGEFVLLAGVAGLLAGAFSMGSGEYVSMRAQKELFERQIELEREELRTMPEEERAELTLIYRAKGLTREEAETAADRIMEDPEIALETLVREELGLDPSELGSPWSASIWSFVAFAFGAVVPVIPFVFSDASWPFVVASGALSAVALFSVGAALSLFTGRSALRSGLRQLGIGIAAAAATFGIGSVIGVTTDV